MLGIVSWYLAHWNDTEKYPGARLCFTEIIAGLATVYGSIFIWTWDWFPRLSALINLLFSLAFFAAYGALIAWEYDKNWVGWKADMGESYKACWRAVEAFTFINGVLFLHSAGFALENSVHTPYQHNVPQGQRKQQYCADATSLTGSRKPIMTDWLASLSPTLHAYGS